MPTEEPVRSSQELLSLTPVGLIGRNTDTDRNLLFGAGAEKSIGLPQTFIESIMGSLAGLVNRQKNAGCDMQHFLFAMSVPSLLGQDCSIGAFITCTVFSS